MLVAVVVPVDVSVVVAGSTVVLVPGSLPELLERHGEVRVLHLSGKRALEREAQAARRVDVPLVAGHEERHEKRKALDVVPMRVGEHQVAAQRPLAGRRERHAEIVRPGAAIEDDQRSVVCSKLDT